MSNNRFIIFTILTKLVTFNIHLETIILKERGLPLYYLINKYWVVKLKRVVKSLQLSYEMKDELRHDGFFGLLVEGRQRIGKSSYCCQAKAETLGKWEYTRSNGVELVEAVKPNYEAVKNYIVFPPEEFLDAILKIGLSDKISSLLWDDAGFWLFALDWYDPFVKIVSRYIQLAGRQMACLMLTSPSQKLISGKVLEALPEMYVGKIIKTSGDTQTYRPRRAKVYQRWTYPDGKRGGVHTRWEDDYNVMLPQDFFDWYKPKSDHYLDEALLLMKAEVAVLKNKLKKRQGLLKEPDVMEKVYGVTGTPSRMKEVDEVLKNIESEQKKKKTG